MSQASFNVRPDESLLINRIVKRAVVIAARNGIKINATNLRKDVTACHANGVPLDLYRLLITNDGTFEHDVFGIRRYIDRDTGKLGDCFVPICAKAVPPRAFSRK